MLIPKLNTFGVFFVVSIVSLLDEGETHKEYKVSY